MDFEKLLHIARKNDLDKKEPIRCLQTKFKPPTKEQQKRDKVLSEGVQKFLARKEEEERRKKKEDDRKREELNALRAKDPKANKRIQHMLKRTKSANKSVMEDVDTTNTADTLAGPSQPDEDDYGFVSGESAAMFDKLLAKMYSTPSNDEVKFAPAKKPTTGNLLNTKERVKMALLKQEEDEKGPRKRKRKKADNVGEEEDDDDIVYSRFPEQDEKKESEKNEKLKQKRPPGPPPMDFMELLKLAEKKQHEPIAFEPKVKKDAEPEQLMTKRQRIEHEKAMEFKRQRELRLKALERKEVPQENGIGKSSTKRIPKVGQTSSEQRIESTKINGISKSKSELTSAVGNKATKVAVISEKPKSDFKIPKSADIKSVQNKAKSSSAPLVSKKSIESENEKLKRERDEVLKLLKEKEEAVRILEEKQRLIRERDEALAKLKKLEEKQVKEKPSSSNLPSKPSGQPRPTSSTSAKALDAKKVPEKVPIREFPPKDLKKQEPSKVAVREFPPKDVRGISNGNRQLTKEQKIQLLKKRLAEQKRRRIQDSDDEYDSELDDFIDDGPDPTMPKEDISKAISQIFNYNKDRYSAYDDDNECMESNWSQISKEEYYSTKCGILEDLKDMQAEKEALARKKAKMKKK